MSGRAVGAEELFTAERRHLLGVAYRLLGTLTDAEDVLQDVFERWLRADRASVENPSAYLTTMTTRVAIDRLRSARATREVYVGPWLPEPVPTPGGPLGGTGVGRDPAAVAELDESLTIGFLHLLEQLTPLERAAYLLHDVFDFPYREIATMLDRNEDACRQLASRARSKVKASRPDEYHTPAPELEADVCQRLLGAVAGGDVAAVMALLTPDVVHVADGGPDHRAARQPIVGPDRVARYLVNLAARLPGLEGFADSAAAGGPPADPSGTTPSLELRMLRVNGQQGLLVLVDGLPLTLLVIELADELIHRLYAVVNPDKLRAVAG